MLIKSIEFPEEIIDPNNDSIDVLVESANGYTYTIVVSTPVHLITEMNYEKINFIKPRTFPVIVKKLTEKIITEAIQAYAEDEGYWLKLHQFSRDIDISVLNKLEAKHKKEWELDD